MEFLQQIVNGLAVGSTYAVVALGFGLVFSVMGVINLAHPEFFMLGAFVASVLGTAFVGTLAPIVLFVVVILAAIALTSALGITLELVVIRPLRTRYILIPFIATAGVSIVIVNVVESIYGANPVSIPQILPIRVFDISGVQITSAQVVVLVAGIFLMGSISYYIRKTRFGRAVRAISEKPETAAACGVNVNFVSQMTMAISAGSAGVAGVTIGLVLQSASPSMGLLFGVKSFVCMLVAGNRHIEGIVAVGLVLGVLEALIAGYVSSNFRDAAAFAVLLVVLFFRPTGLFGSYTHSEARA